MGIDNPCQKLVENFQNLRPRKKRQVFYYSTFNFSTLEELDNPELSDKVREARKELKKTIFSRFKDFNHITNDKKKEDLLAQYVDHGIFGDHLLAHILQEQEGRYMPKYKPNCNIDGHEFDVRVTLDDHLFEIKRLLTGSTLQNDIEEIADIPDVVLDNYRNYFIYCLCPLIGRRQGEPTLSMTLQYVVKDYIYELNPEISTDFLKVRVIPIDEGLKPEDNLRIIRKRSGQLPELD